MAFNPSLPVNGSLITAAELRAQFNGLADLIAAMVPLVGAQVDSVSTLPAGSAATAGVSLVNAQLHFTFAIPQGEVGPQGPPFATAVVDSVTTLPPGDVAQVVTSYDGTNVHFQFGIPQGDPGAQGVAGPQGPPFADAVIDMVTTVDAGQPAQVSTSFDGTNVHFQFSIPRGAQGVPGEVSAAQLDTAIAGTSSNTNGVDTLNSQFLNDPPTAADMEVLRSKMNELILALRR